MSSPREFTLISRPIVYNCLLQLRLIPNYFKRSDNNGPKSYARSLYKNKRQREDLNKQTMLYYIFSFFGRQVAIKLNRISYMVVRDIFSNSLMHNKPNQLNLFEC